ncbi:MAG: succinate--CoA ligase subunit alpha [Bacillota bacterium]
MAVFVDRDTRVIIQGITGTQGNYHAKKMLEYGARLVGGVTPGKGGQVVEDVPVFDTVAEAREAVGAQASMILVPPAFVYDAGVEAIEAGLETVVIITEHVPVQDAMRLAGLARRRGVRLVGPNTIGVISPGLSKVGIMPGYIYSRGSVGIVSRSGTLTHEISSNLTFRGIGQSTCVGIGGDPIVGTTFTDVLAAFRDDPETKVVVMVGEIGGAAEEGAAAYIKETAYPKPVIAFIAGQTAPPEKRMGHAGAIVQGSSGTATSKVKALTEAGVIVSPTLDGVLEEVKKRLA